MKIETELAIAINEFKAKFIQDRWKLDVYQSLDKIFSIAYKKYHPSIILHEKGSLFYRIRKTDDFGIEMPFEKNCWYPPLSGTDRYGRLNSPTEQVLYTSKNINTCIAEMKIDTNMQHPFALMVYETTSDVAMHEIDISDSPAMHDFLVWVMTSSDLHKMANMVAKRFFAANEPLDGWQYCSVKNPDTDRNMCFNKDGVSKLKLRGVYRVSKLFPCADTVIYDMCGIPQENGTMKYATAKDKSFNRIRKHIGDGLLKDEQLPLLVGEMH